MDSDHETLSFHIEVCWFLKDKMLGGFFELRKEKNSQLQISGDLNLAVVGNIFMFEDKLQLWEGTVEKNCLCDIRSTGQ